MHFRFFRRVVLVVSPHSSGQQSTVLHSAANMSYQILIEFALIQDSSMAKQGVLLHQRGSGPWQDTALYRRCLMNTEDAPGFPAGLQRRPGLLQVLCHVQLCMNNRTINSRTINIQVRGLRNSGICHYQSQ